MKTTFSGRVEMVKTKLSEKYTYLGGRGLIGIFATIAQQ